MKDYLDYLKKWLKEKVSIANCNGIVLAVSGGIDSTVIAFLANQVFKKEQIELIYLPINSSQLSKENAKLVFKSLNFEFKEINLSDLNQSFIKLFEKEYKELNSISLLNLKPRLRMNVVYFIANLKNYLVLGTSNFDEIYTGYFTKYGDGGADLYPIFNLNKEEVRMLAKELNVPFQLIDQEPSADLYLGQTDEKELGIYYQDLDKYVNNGKIDLDIVKKIESLHLKSKHKINNLIRPDKFYSKKIDLN